MQSDQDVGFVEPQRGDVAKIIDRFLPIARGPFPDRFSD